MLPGDKFRRRANELFQLGFSGRMFVCPPILDSDGEELWKSYQDLRNFFDGGYNTSSSDTRQLFEYLSSASVIFAVVNLERFLKEPQSEDRIVLSEIVRFLSKNAEVQHLYFVFTAWDKAAEAVLDKHGSLREYIRRELTPFYRTCESVWKQGKGIYFLAVAPIAQTVYDVPNNEFIPKKDFKSYNLDNFTKVLIQSIASLQGKTKRPTWDDATTHPHDEQLYSEWRNRERDMKRKSSWEKFLKFVGIKKQGQKTIEKIASNFNNVADGIGAWNTFTQRYAQFTGRARRREYWNFSIIATILMFTLLGLCGRSLAIVPLIASSPKSVGKFWLRQLAKSMI